ncbi:MULTISPECIES: ABC transporter ATP-binding protein [Bradyrhizobium]|uniref:ABC transporter ATP-binding protein n=1 Tax=Bradyrhizobium frederickii TaxID=2560054 RepID=A0A4Y9NXT7_9BRAD|nr:MULTISPECIES: ABC transporter ATP-binding protein [Bradyrhizobium]RTE91213.1 ABC transporter ATP-binding protein [Bradyrhizobium sp. LVM 105]TFV35577.1 ABC transporter ATP-binding protein [Bradyrhizobium frederickii]TFV72674.1 ABC transporter ATP-binding protein [Bradyrhizobium frederickii]
MVEAQGGRSLVVDAVTHRYPSGALAVENINLDIKGGEIIALLGPSGCGKTTLLRIIAGFIAQSQGRIIIGDDIVDALPPNRRAVGIVFQNYALFPHLSISENVGYGLAARGIDKATRQREAQRLLELVQLPAMAERLPRQLSGGQQQRVALARALAIKPSILLLDEPFAALDKNLRLDMQIEIKRLQRVSGITTLIVTHDQEEALSMADRVAVLSHGKLEQFGTPSDIYDRPQTLFVNTFVGSTNRMPGVVVSADRTAAKVRLDAGAEIIARPAAASLAEGGRVTVCIRPEHLQFVADETGFAGVVGMSLPLGATVVHEITTADGSGVKISQARIGATHALESGAAVRLAPLAPSLANAFPATL